MKKEIIHTDRAPAAVGPYSQAVRAGNLLFVSGQIPLDPETGEMVDGDIREQTRQALENLRAVLDAGGSGLDRVIKSTVFILRMEEFSLVNEVYGEFFPVDPPARACIEVSALPKGARVEVEAVALCSD
ncbi:MAG: RidA family protein [Deltaproteobacteria bacterium]|nr:RidA family protein [Deltaproteobacteria bacterium]MBW2129392.1 RidA family protein [Deltaproteobacteria bacterium]MBW2305022.1 RidA family protein [Deltaproteobacteria bacterium]